MKVLITEQQLQILRELSNRIRENIDIIYQDSNVTCLIPKSQETSKLYGHGANWCQKSKSGFEQWSEQGLLVRFLFRGGKKIRFTYYFKDTNLHNYYWAGETGHHVLFGDTTNPFDVVNTTGRIRGLEQNIIDSIHRIPDECKQKVLEFIRNNENGYNYCYNNTEYKSKKEIVRQNNVNILLEKYKKYIDYIDTKSRTFFDLSLNEQLKYGLTYNINDDLVDVIESDDFDEFKSIVYKKLTEILSYIKENNVQNKNREEKPILYYSGGKGFES